MDGKFKFFVILTPRNHPEKAGKPKSVTYFNLCVLGILVIVPYMFCYMNIS